MVNGHGAFRKPPALACNDSESELRTVVWKNHHKYIVYYIYILHYIYIYTYICYICYICYIRYICYICHLFIYLSRFDLFTHILGFPYMRVPQNRGFQS